MKPVKLTIEGVNSFIEKQTLDFEAAGRSNLFCISGKTGAGKTTIFDSIMLALYGKSAKGNLADVVNLSLMSARVVLEFSENGELYTVERTIKCRFEKDANGKKTDKRIASADCVLYKNDAPIAKGEYANEIILGIIGLEAAEFKNVYLLEQGEYAEFLKKTPAKQTEAVGKIFSLMRFGDVYKLAGDRSRELIAEINGVEREISGIGDASPDALREQKDELKVLKSKTTSLGKECEAHVTELLKLEKTRDLYISARSKQENVKNLMLQADEAQRREFEAKQALEQFESALDPADGDRLKEKRDELNKLAELSRVDREYAAAQSELISRTAALEKKKGEVESAEQNLAQTEQKKQDAKNALSGKLNEFFAKANEISPQSDTLRAVVAALSEKPASESEIAEAIYKIMTERKAYLDKAALRDKTAAELKCVSLECQRRLSIIERYVGESEQLSASLAAAEENAQKAKSDLNAALVCSHAAAVRSELNAGDVCPVCGGVYGGATGENAADSDTEKYKALLASAESELKRVQHEKVECDKHLERAKTEYENTNNGCNKMKAEIDELEKLLADSCVNPDVYTRLMALLFESKSFAEDAKAAAEQWLTQGPQVTVLKAELNAISENIEKLQKKSQAFRAELGELCGSTDGKISALKAQIGELEQRLSKTENERKRLSGDVQAKAAAVAAIESSLESARAECPVDMPEFDEQDYADKRDALDRIKKQLAQNEKDIAIKELTVATLSQKCDKISELKKMSESLKKRADMYDKIAELTRGKAMLNYVAAEYIAEFTQIAGEILNELSSGKYTMSYDKTNGFIVYDYLNEGKPRKTDTLSGGELFLASLSVAIAIARTQSSGNNAFFFLDEGFGTLDEDLIDVVYGALESLSKDCLVGVITHAEALITRMPFTVNVVEASDTCGSKIIQN